MSLIRVLASHANARSLRIVGAAAIGAVLYANPASANVVWPAMLLSYKLLTPFPIALGLVVEYVAVRAISDFGIRKAILVTGAMNLASFLAGVVAVPLVGLVWEVFHACVLGLFFHTPTFTPFNWAVSIILAAATSASIEWLVIRYRFKTRIGKKGFAVLVFANLASTTLAFGLVLLSPPEF